MPSSATVSSGFRFVYQAAAVAVLGTIVAGCSSTRFDDSLLTGATQGGQALTAANQPMPPALVGNGAATNGRVNAVTVAGLPSPAGPPTDFATSSVTPPASQGAIVAVAPGDTLYGLARAHGVSVAAIAGSNGLTQTSTLTVGQRLVIPAPGSVAALGTPPAPLGVIPGNGAAPAAQTASQPSGSPGFHTVQTGETIFSIAMGYGVSPNQVAAANNLASIEVVQVGQRLAIPGASAGSQQVAVAQPAGPTPPVNNLAVANPQVAAINATPATVTDAAPVQIAAIPAQNETLDPPSIDGTSFRWPARGRVISDFGPKPSGERNDGINLSVPVGTEIHASETGVVIYAGNGIAGYGNLVLIEHADNWVTAYAHTSEMLVGREDVVQRGQVIALAGNTGSVTASQLHFELRRGTVPVNPLDYLND